MKRIGLEDQKAIEIEILDFVVDFCEKHAISYWLDRGTLIGAIRHRGFIPWDDDIDIGMMRNDYDNFINMFGDPLGRYELRCGDKDSSFLCPFAKVMDTRTMLYEPDEHGLKLAVGIDIIPLDPIPDDDKIVKRIYNKRDCLKLLNNLQANVVRPKKKYRAAVAMFLHVILSAFPRGLFMKRIIKQAQKYSNQKTEYLGDYTVIYRIKSKKEWFSSFKMVPFENKEYCVPVGYDKYLRDLYGDYMKLPSEERQHKVHNTLAYFKD